MYPSFVIKTRKQKQFTIILYHHIHKYFLICKLESSVTYPEHILITGRYEEIFFLYILFYDNVMCVFTMFVLNVYLYYKYAF